MHHVRVFGFLTAPLAVRGGKVLSFPKKIHISAWNTQSNMWPGSSKSPPLITSLPGRDITKGVKKQQHVSLYIPTSLRPSPFP